MALGTNRPKRWQVTQPVVTEEMPVPQQVVTAAKLHRRLGSVSPRMFQAEQSTEATEADSEATETNDAAAVTRRRSRPPRPRE